jgi:hypothetical protein
MNYNQLSIDQSPALATPLQFFLSAPLFGMAAALLMLFTGPQLLQDRWLPAALATTHLITLGFITMCMIGALYQMLPVLVGTRLYRSDISSKIIHSGLSLGILLLTIGLIGHRTALVIAAAVLLGCTLLLFLISISIALLSRPAARATATGMRLAVVALWIAAGYGLLLASGHGIDSLPLYRQHTSIHLLWSALGWVTLLIIAVSYQVIPMFQVTREYPEPIKRLLIPGLFIALVSATLQHHFLHSPGWLRQLVTIALYVGLLSYAMVTLRLLLKRNKKRTDTSFFYWLFALAMLSISLIVYAFTDPGHPQLYALTAITFFVGFVMSVINGMLYKIVPFLVWLHLHRIARINGHSLLALPTINAVIASAPSLHQFELHVATVALLMLATLFPGDLFYLAGIALLAACLLLEINLFSALRVYRTHLHRLSAMPHPQDHSDPAAGLDENQG